MYSKTLEEKEKNMTEPLITEKRINAYEGIKVKTIKQNGSTGQKLAVKLFDTDRNGVLDKNEADCFNNFTFTSKPKELTMYRTVDGKKQATVIKYENIEDLEHSRISVNNHCSFRFGEKHYLDDRNKSLGCVFDSGINIDVNYKKAVVDMKNKKVAIEGNGRNNHDTDISAWGIELTLNNVDVKNIDFNDGTLNLKNTSNKEKYFDRATQIETCGNWGTEIRINKDSDSKFKLNKYS